MKLQAEARRLYPILMGKAAKGMYKAYSSMVADVSRRFS